MSMTNTLPPLFVDVAGDHLDRVLQLLDSRPPTTQQLLAQHPPVPIEADDDSMA